MIFEKNSIKDSYIINLNKINDERGFFKDYIVQKY